MLHPFKILKPEYDRLLASMTFDLDIRSELNAVAEKLTGPLCFPRYKSVQDEDGVPIVFIGPADQRESNANAHLALGQGDPWDQVSTHVPRGFGPWSSWKAAALFYLHREHLDDTTQDWSFPYLCWKFECWNGFGYRAHGIHSPYLWAGTNHYTRGKYVADGVFDPHAEDRQLGTIPVALRMMQIMPELKLAGTVMPAGGGTIKPQPVPMGVGASVGVHDVKWLQEALNKVFLPASEELVVDGSYGKHTRSAVWRYQAARGLTVDGLYGPETDEQLSRDINDLHK